MKLLIELTEISLNERIRIAAHTADQNVLNVFSRDEEKDVRLEVARNEWTPPEVLDRLSDDCSPYIRRAVAANKNVLPKTLSDLAFDENYFVRLAVARNEKSPKEILSILAKEDKEREVKCACARNVNLPVETLEKLARSDDPCVRRNVMLNSKTSLNIISEHVTDADEGTRRVALHKMNMNMNK